MAPPAAPRRPRLPTALMYAAFAVIFVFVAVYTALHLVFYGFSGQAVGIDFLAGFVLPLVWIVGLLTAIRLRARPTLSRRWGFAFLIVLVVLLVIDTVRFQPLFAS